MVDRRAPPRADVVTVTRLRSTSRPTRNRAARTYASATAALAAAILPSTAAAAPGSGTGASVWVLAAIGAIVLVLTLMRLRAGRRGARISITDVADGRQILIARGRRVTEELTNLTDVVAEREDEGTTRHHQHALDIVTTVRSRIGRTSGQRVQSRAHQDLDEAEWLIGVLRARLDGFVEPAQPGSAMPATCFFDGAHGLATVEVDLEGISLQRIPVRSCAKCAVTLVRGERPPVGSAEMGGRSIPWPAAPRWCGSWGWAVKDLKHLTYDGTSIFADEPREESRRRRQTVAERARGRRARVLSDGPVLLPEEEPLAITDELDADGPAPERRVGDRRTGERRQGEPHADEHRPDEHHAELPRVRSAFALDEDAPAVTETAPVATGDTPPD